MDLENKQTHALNSDEIQTTNFVSLVNHRLQKLLQQEKIQSSEDIKEDTHTGDWHTRASHAVPGSNPVPNCIHMREGNGSPTKDKAGQVLIHKETRF